EPFFGSGAVLFMRPHRPKYETINDKDGFISNLFRAIKYNPEAVAEHIDWPINENDLYARNKYLISKKESLREQVEADPEYYDAKIAGWWIWGRCLWIGDDFCLHAFRGRPRLRKSGLLCAQSPIEILRLYQHRLINVRVISGCWNRICGNTPTIHTASPIGIFFDPPYSSRDRHVHYIQDDFNVAKNARDWAIEKGADSRFRIAFCGYDGEFETPWPEGWLEFKWKTKGGYANRSNKQGKLNKERERIWFSPYCIKPEEKLFEP
ncbi:MAG: DNA adenine methylase, partial [Deltaproteobacteria bacterium]|nr:DNA adenine methylase [Deltaproteobacteria bacterium]